MIHELHYKAKEFFRLQEENLHERFRHSKRHTKVIRLKLLEFIYQSLELLNYVVKEEDLIGCEEPFFMGEWKKDGDYWITNGTTVITISEMESVSSMLSMHPELIINPKHPLVNNIEYWAEVNNVEL